MDLLGKKAGDLRAPAKKRRWTKIKRFNTPKFGGKSRKKEKRGLVKVRKP